MTTIKPGDLVTHRLYPRARKVLAVHGEWLWLDEGHPQERPFTARESHVCAAPRPIEEGQRWRLAGLRTADTYTVEVLEVTERHVLFKSVLEGVSTIWARTHETFRSCYEHDDET